MYARRYAAKKSVNLTAHSEKIPKAQSAFGISIYFFPVTVSDGSADCRAEI